MSDEQRCGNCKWFRVNELVKPDGRCVVPVPFWAGVPYAVIRANTIRKCPCWSRKESDDGK